MERRLPATPPALPLLQREAISAARRPAHLPLHGCGSSAVRRHCGQPPEASAWAMGKGDIHPDWSLPLNHGIGRPGMLQTLDISDNHLIGSILSSVVDLKNLNYLKLNINGLSGVLPDSLATINGLALVYFI